MRQSDKGYRVNGIVKGPQTSVATVGEANIDSRLQDATFLHDSRFSANILSLSWLIDAVQEKKERSGTTSAEDNIYLDTDTDGGEFHLILDGKVKMKFRRNAKGLFTSEFPRQQLSDEEAIDLTTLLAATDEVVVLLEEGETEVPKRETQRSSSPKKRVKISPEDATTVRDELANFRKKDQQKLIAMRRFEQIMAYPYKGTMERMLKMSKFKSLKLNQDDLERAYKIWGKSEARAMGSAVNRNVSLSQSPIIQVQPSSPQEMFIDVGFFSGLPILVTKTKPCDMTITQTLKGGDQTASAIRDAVVKVVNKFRNQGIIVARITIGGEGSATKCGPDLGEMTRAVINKVPSVHVPQVERAMRTLKEPVRSKINATKWEIPIFLMGEVVAYCENRVNQNLRAGKEYTPWELFHKCEIDVDKFASLDFGKYCLINSSINTENTMKTRVVGAISMRPLNNSGGTHRFFVGLDAYQRPVYVSRARWEETPMPEEVQEVLEGWASTFGSCSCINNSGPTFHLTQGKEVEDPVDLPNEEDDPNLETELNKMIQDRQPLSNDVEADEELVELQRGEEFIKELIEESRQEDKVLGELGGQEMSTQEQTLSIANSAVDVSVANSAAEQNSSIANSAVDVSVANSAAEQNSSIANSAVDAPVAHSATEQNSSIASSAVDVSAARSVAEQNSPIVNSAVDASVARSATEQNSPIINSVVDDSVAPSVAEHLKYINSSAHAPRIERVDTSVNKTLTPVQQLTVKKLVHAAKKKSLNEQLMDAAILGDAKLVDQLVRRGANPNTVDGEGEDSHWIPSKSALPTVEHRAITRSRARAILYTCYQLTVHQAIRKDETKASEAITSEFTQIKDKGTYEFVDYDNLTEEQITSIIPCSMFLKEKFDSVGDFIKLKARFVAGGHRQDRSALIKEETSSPTVNLLNVKMVAAIAHREGRKVATVDIGGAFLHSDWKGPEVIIRVPSTLAKYMANADENAHQNMDNNGNVFIKLKKALYGCVQSSKLWYDNLASKLASMGFSANKYEPCVFNKSDKSTGYKQCTVCVYVDDLMITCVNEVAIQSVIDELRAEYKEVTGQVGVKHSYLGMCFDFSDPMGVRITMPAFEDQLLSQADFQFERVESPATESIFIIDDDSPFLGETDAAKFHSLVQSFLYLIQRSRPDMTLPVSFLTTRVQQPTAQDLVKLHRVMNYLYSTRGMGLRLYSDPVQNLSITAYSDAAYGVHRKDGKSQSAGVMTFGNGAVDASCRKQTIMGKSAAEVELIAMSDYGSVIIGARNFLIEQGEVDIKPVSYKGDNTAAITLIRNGR